MTVVELIERLELYKDNINEVILVNEYYDYDIQEDIEIKYEYGRVEIHAKD